MDTLKNVKVILGINSEERDDLLSLLITQAESRLKLRINAENVPDELEYIIMEITVKRYNKIGSEGLSSHSVEGESMNFDSDDFASYENDINAYLAREKKARRGVQFI